MFNNIKKNEILIRCLVTILWLCLLTFSFWYYIYDTNESKSNFPDWRSAYGFTSNMQVIKLKIGKEHFLIPNAYIHNKANWKSGKTFSLAFHTLLPDLKPYTESNKLDFEAGKNIIRGWLHADRLFESSTNGRTNGYFEWFEKLRKEAQQNVVQDSVSGLKLLKNQPGYDVYFQDPEGESFFIVMCNIQWRSCSVERSFKDLWLSYSYPLEHLKDWKQLDQNLDKLLLSFEEKN